MAAAGALRASDCSGADGSQPNRVLLQLSAPATDAASSAQPAAAGGGDPRGATAATVTAAADSRDGEGLRDRRAEARQRRGLVHPRVGHTLAGDPEGSPGPAPQWPFEGLVQLAWGSFSDSHFKNVPEGWFLRFYSYQRRNESGTWPYWSVTHVQLPEMSVECAGKAGLVVDGSDGIVVGGPRGAVSTSYRVPWGAAAVALHSPPEMLLEEIERRSSNIAVETAGDYVNLGDAEQGVRFALREPARSSGTWWYAQVRHDGDVAVAFVQPARHECFSGITWLIAAHSGEILACGADTAATRWVSPDLGPAAELVLPEAASIPDYLACAFPLDPHILQQGPPD